jgi:hypothetical protein
MKRLAVLATLLGSLLLSASAQISQETTIRQTYAIASFATQVGLIERTVPAGSLKAVPNLSKTLQDNQLTFTLSNFKEGEVVGNQEPLASLCTDFTGKQVIDLQPATGSFNHPGDKDYIASENILLTRWTTGQDMSDRGQHFTIADLDILGNPGDNAWTHYVSYDVVATYQGKTVPYKATFLFDDSGRASAHDPFLQDGGLGSVLLDPKAFFPAILLRTLGHNASVIEWLKANQAPPGSAAGELFCDLDAMKCSIPPPSLERTVE